MTGYGPLIYNLKVGLPWACEKMQDRAGVSHAIAAERLYQRYIPEFYEHRLPRCL
jgi:hypothetical protein